MPPEKKPELKEEEEEVVAAPVPQGKKKEKKSKKDKKEKKEKKGEKEEKNGEKEEKKEEKQETAEGQGGGEEQEATAEKEEEKLPAPIDVEFYDVLGLPHTCTPSQIKKAYFLKARKCHPDKNPDNPEAGEQFKRLAQAYEALSDPERRLAYHRFGKEAVTGGMGEVNPRALFSMLFGGGRFHHIFGDVSLGDPDMDLESMDEEEREKAFAAALEERVASLVENLLKRIEPFVEGDKEAFVNQVREEAEELRKESFGSELLRLVGWTYENEAKKHLKGFLGITGFVASVKEKGHMVNELLKTLSQAISVSVYEEELSTMEFESEEQRREMELELHKQSILAMWRVARMDVESAVRKTCQKVMRDPEVARDVAKKRMLAVKAMGRIWKGVRPEKGKEGCWEFFADLDKMGGDAMDAASSMANSWKRAQPRDKLLTYNPLTREEKEQNAKNTARAEEERAAQAEKAKAEGADGKKEKEDAEAAGEENAS